MGLERGVGVGDRKIEGIKQQSLDVQVAWGPLTVAKETSPAMVAIHKG